MRNLLRAFVIILTLKTGTAASANSSVFKGTLKQNPEFSECVKAIEKGVVITIRENGSHIFFYKNKLYTIRGGATVMVCMVGENLTKQ
jgi:hypothetical protein